MARIYTCCLIISCLISAGFGYLIGVAVERHQEDGRIRQMLIDADRLSRRVDELEMERAEVARDVLFLRDYISELRRGRDEP